MINYQVFVLFFLNAVIYSSRVYGFSPSPLIPNKLLTSCVRAKNVDGKDINDEDIRLSDISLNRRSVLTIGTAAASLSLLRQPTNAAIDTKTVKIPEWTISNNVKFPTLALNTAGLSSQETYQAVKHARSEGIAHIDFHPGIERDGVAEYLSKNKDERELLFLNTKIRKPPLDISPQDAASLARDQITDDLRILNVDNVIQQRIKHTNNI